VSGAAPRYWPRLLPLLAALAVATRLPSFLRPVWNPDEGFLATQARMLSDGGVLYDTVVDRKPPLLPWAYQGLFAVFGDGSLQPVRVLAVLAHLATAAALVAVARRRWGNAAGTSAGVLYLLVSIGLAPEDAQAASFEVFILPSTVAAFHLADRRRWVAAGTCAALAALTKQTGGAVLLPVLWMVWRHGDGGRAAARGALRAGAGFLLPLAVAALLTGPARFVFWTVTGSGSYGSLPRGAALVALARALGNAAILCVAAGALVAAIGRLLLRHRRVADSDLWVWLGSSAMAIAVGFHFFGHYYLQLVPPLVLLGVAALRGLPGWQRPALVSTVLASAGFLAWGLVHPTRELDHDRAVAQAVARHTRPQDRVLIWGMHPEDYWLADRAPASRYLTAGFLTNFSGGRGHLPVDQRQAVPGAWRTFEDETRRRLPALIVDDSRGAPYGPAALPGLRRMLHRHYRPIGWVDGAVLYAPAGRDADARELDVRGPDAHDGDARDGDAQGPAAGRPAGPGSAAAHRPWAGHQGAEPAHPAAQLAVGRHHQAGPLRLLDHGRPHLLHDPVVAAAGRGRHPDPGDGRHLAGRALDHQQHVQGRLTGPRGHVGALRQPLPGQAHQGVAQPLVRAEPVAPPPVRHRAHHVRSVHDD
jgi:Dolichyl-phosphate-mannose-protein mannosyltransferase